MPAAPPQQLRPAPDTRPATAPASPPPKTKRDTRCERSGVRGGGRENERPRVGSGVRRLGEADRQSERERERKQRFRDARETERGMERDRIAHPSPPRPALPLHPSAGRPWGHVVQAREREREHASGHVAPARCTAWSRPHGTPAHSVRHSPAPARLRPVRPSHPADQHAPHRNRAGPGPSESPGRPAGPDQARAMRGVLGGGHGRPGPDRAHGPIGRPGDAPRRAVRRRR